MARQGRHYPGKARDQDRQLQDLLSFDIDYVAQPFIESGLCVDTTLERWTTGSRWPAE